jgi:hypothetical protein
MKDFKFFQKKVKGTLDLYEGETRATASFDADTPEGHMFRRRLYHTDRDYYDRLHNFTNNNEMERYYYDRQLGRFETAQSRQRIEDNERAERIIRRLNGRETTGAPIFTGESRATKLNPKWWMKIKMFFQTISLYWDQIWGIIIIASTVTIIFGLMIAKVLNIW